MNYVARKLLTLVTESALENYLKRDLERLGAEGYTIVDARGKGGSGERAGDWSRASTNIRVEVVCDAATAESIAAHCHERYAPNYGLILYVQDVDVLLENDS